MDLRNERIEGTKDYFMVSNWVAGENVVSLRKSANLEGKARCANMLL